MTAEQAGAELRSLMYDEDKKWFYAYAMGAGCTTEDNGEISAAIRRRVTDLRAVIADDRRLQVLEVTGGVPTAPPASREDAEAA
jgi:hypothetical protein